jgi:hypothetical protein
MASCHHLAVVSGSVPESLVMHTMSDPAAASILFFRDFFFRFGFFMTGPGSRILMNISHSTIITEPIKPRAALPYSWDGC